MPDDLYTRDALLWSEQQAGFLRRVAAGERLNTTVDWPNILEEILDVGLSELHACESLLEQALLHLLKLHGRPASLAASHWHGELFAFLGGARRRYTPSMAQRIDLQSIYEDALKQACVMLADGSPLPDWPQVCPYTAAVLVDRNSEVGALLSLLGAVAESGQ